MVPSIGRIVHYRLSDDDVKNINKRREDAYNNLDQHRTNKTGVVVHCGNGVEAGNVFPLLITRVWGDTHGSSVNGQVFLDGCDCLWVTSVVEGTGNRTWFDPPRV